MDDTGGSPTSIRERIKSDALTLKAKYRVTEVISAVHKERQFQDAKWGSIVERPHSLPEWILIAEAELNEAKWAVIKGGSGRNSVRAEIVQVMAVLQAALEQHGVQDDHEGRQL